MFSFLKNWKNKDNGKERSVEEIKLDIQEDSAIEADELRSGSSPEAESAQSAAAQRPLLKTELSLHPAWDQHLDPEKKYTLRFLQAELPALKDHTIAVTGFSMIPALDGITVALFLRNVSAHPVLFQNITMTLKLDDRSFARNRFDLSAVGEIPPYSSRPWEVFFPTESFLQDNFAFNRWKIEMNLGERAWPKFLHIDPQMEDRMTERQKDRLELIASSLPAMKPGEVQITGFDIGKTSDGRLVAALLFRNARYDMYNPKKLKVKIYDAQNDLVASGGIDASSVRVMPGTARPWLIVFPAEMLKKPDADLRKWALDVTE